jgi:hypothetical protein
MPQGSGEAEIWQLAAGMRPFRAGTSLAGSHVMQAPWIFSSTFLPYTGEPIDFMLEDRSQPIHGTFGDGAFHSRWADYDAQRVLSWRVADPDLATPVAILAPAPAGAFVTMMRRWAHGFSGASNLVATAPPRSHCRTTAAPAFVKSPACVAARHFDSNQISS